MEKNNTSSNNEDNKQYMIYDWQPKWLKTISFSEFKKIEDIFWLFLLVAPSDKECYQAKRLKYFDWNDKKLWSENNYIYEELTRIFTIDDNCLGEFKTYKELNEELAKKNIDEKNIDKEKREICFFIYKSKKATTLDFFRHVRNSFAHGRFALNDEYLIMEDVDINKNADYKNKKVSINALIVIKIENMKKIVKIIAQKNKID